MLIFRMAVRRNNAELIHAAKFMTKDLFHGRTHSKYQMIELHDTIQYQLMEPEVQRLIDGNTSI